MSHSRWQMPSRLPAESPSFPGRIEAGMDLPPLLAQLLYNRGITDPALIDSFLAADERLLNDPFLLPDMDKAIARVYRALLSGETIAIYGDFDADGITATALLTQGLSSLGGRAVPYIPHRIEEGYGLNHTALENLYKQGVSLVITVDCGISGAPEVERARRMGLDIVITDHHTVPRQMPPAIATVDPKRADSSYPFPELAGVGVAFKLLQALLSSVGKEKDLAQFLDLVALGTVADMVPLLGENRYLVKRGLEVLHNTSRLGLREMARRAGVPLSSIDTEAISWVLGPRLNAAGRLDHAIISYDLLSTDSSEEAQRLASLLEGKNAERQRLTEAVFDKAREKLIATGTDPPLLMVGGEDFPSGVVGVVAGRLVEEFYRPVVVFERGKEWSKGSGRSIPEFDIIAALTDCSDLLSRFGGHPMAAGFTIATEDLERLQGCLLAIAANRLVSLDLRPMIPIDAEIPLSSLQGKTFGMMQQLAPFGCANHYPTFISRDVIVVDCRSVGSRGEHLRLKLRDGDVTWDSIAFRMGNLIDEVAPRLDIVYNLEVDQWRGGEMLQLNILDFASST
ncbi:MAG: single-stranded-DNA-specific exonuclease RecJ [Dehalococcoidia bacterium]|nr:single-stranded-DNA-specific exonuclease RecJ [Dehalococcoidia bacterium]